MADTVDSKSTEVIPRAGSSPASGTIINEFYELATFNFKCEKCGYICYNVISFHTYRVADCVDINCEKCGQMYQVVVNPVKCISNKCAAIGNQRCKKFNSIVIRPLILDL